MSSLFTKKSALVKQALRHSILLFHAFKQQMSRLASIASSFVKQNRSPYGMGPLFTREAQQAVFSDRVLEAVLLHKKNGVIDSILAWPDKA